MFSYCSNFYIFWLMQWKTELFSVDFWPCYWKAKWNVLMFLHLEQFCTVRVVLTSHCMMKRSLYDINISYWDPPVIQLLNVLVCIEKRPPFVDHPYKRKESNSCLYVRYGISTCRFGKFSEEFGIEYNQQNSHNVNREGETQTIVIDQYTTILSREKSS